MQTIADVNGDFQLSNLPPVSLGGGDYIQGQYSGKRYHAVPNSSASLKLEAGEMLTLNFLRKGDIRLYGRVTDTDGNLYDNASIRVEVEELTEPQEQLEHSGGAISNERGEYEIPNLSPGVYRIRAGSFPEEGKEQLTYDGSIELSEGQKEVEYDVILSKAPPRPQREPGIRITKPEYLHKSKVDIATSSRVERFSAESTEGAVWVIDNSYKPYDDGKNLDTLVKLSATGEALLKISYFNVCQTVGGKKMIAVDKKTGDCWVCNLRGLMKVDKDGKELTETDYSDLGSGIAIDEEDGSVVALLSEGTIYGTGMLRFNPEDGRVIQIVEDVSGCSLDINPKDRNIWIVGKNIYKLNPECEILFSLENIIGWCAVDVSVDSNDGAAWIVEREHRQVLDSQTRLIKVSESGEILKAIDMRIDPFSVSVDGNTGDVWIATREEILKFDMDGNLLKSIENSGFCVRVDPKDSSCWVAGKGGVFKYSSSGDLLASNTEFSNDQKWIAVI
jgi:hypothetical protein